jgi:hypothetical protein
MAPLLGVTFEGLPNDIGFHPDIRIVPRAEWTNEFGSWEDVPSRDNENLARATHAVWLPDVSLEMWPDQPTLLPMTEESEARLNDFIAMLSLKGAGAVSYAEMATHLTPGKDGVAGFHTVILRDFATRIDSACLHDFTTLSGSQLQEAIDNWRQIPNRHACVRTAASRLLSSRHSNDSIIDLCIGIEALVGTGSNELVNRISMRAAAMLRTIGLGPSADLAKDIRNIYTYRSQVVHGNPGPYKHFELHNDDGTFVHATRMATMVLTCLLKIYFKHQDLTPDLIDDRFIYAAFDSRPGLPDKFEGL